MTEDINRRLIARIGKRQGRSTWPRAVATEPQVRTPIDILPIMQPDGAERLELRALDQSASSLGPYLFEWRYNVEDVTAFREWLGIYETRLRELCPAHFRYLGTYEALFGASTPLSGGRYHTLWQHADLAGTLHLQRLQQDFQKDGGEKFLEDEDYFLKLLGELISFQEKTSPARANQLYRLVGKAPDRAG